LVARFLSIFLIHRTKTPFRLESPGLWAILPSAYPSSCFLLPMHEASEFKR
jgi:hypothetical protein